MISSCYSRSKERIDKQKAYREMRKANPNYVPRFCVRVVKERVKEPEAIFLRGDAVIVKDYMGRFTREGKVIKNYEDFILVDMGKYIESFKNGDIKRK